MNKFAREMSDSLRAAGIDAASLVESNDDSGFGDAFAIFSFGSLVFKFIKDRGQVFIDLASASAPEKFYQFDDVEIAMGWKSIDQVLERKPPEDINHILTRLYMGWMRSVLQCQANERSSHGNALSFLQKNAETHSLISSRGNG